MGPSSSIDKMENLNDSTNDISMPFSLWSDGQVLTAAE
jgi:hypothetical protein